MATTSLTAADRVVAARVLGAAASAYEVTADAALEAHGPVWGASEAKFATVLVIYRRRHWSLSRIGRALNRDHSTIRNALQRAEWFIENRDADSDWFDEALRRAEVAVELQSQAEAPAAPRPLPRPRPWSLPVPLARGAA